MLESLGNAYDFVGFSDFECSDDEVGQRFFAEERHFDLAVHLGLVLLHRPVLAAHDPNEVEHFGQHHYDERLLFPNHAPEVVDCVLIGSLSGDIGVRLKNALNSIDFISQLIVFSKL